MAIRPQIFSTYSDTRSIVERASHSHIQRYLFRKHDAQKRICLSIHFCQQYCNSSSFLLFYFFALNSIILLPYYHRQSPLLSISPFV